MREQILFWESHTVLFQSCFGKTASKQNRYKMSSCSCSGKENSSHERSLSFMLLFCSAKEGLRQKVLYN